VASTLTVNPELGDSVGARLPDEPDGSRDPRERRRARGTQSSLLTQRVLEAAVERAVAILCQPDDDGRGLRQELVRVGSTLMVLTPRGLPAAGDDVDPLGSVWIRLIPVGTWPLG